MQAVGIDAFGGDVRVFELAAPGSPAPDELVILVRAAGVGNWDEIVRIGDWDVGREPRLALGVEAAGVVAAVGEEVTSFARGDEVLTYPVPLRHQGTWAERLVAPAALVARKPAAVSWETAAAFPVPALTADQALTEAAPAPEFVARTWVWLIVVSASLGNMMSSVWLVLAATWIKNGHGGAGGWTAILVVSAVGALLAGATALRIKPRRPLLLASVVVVPNAAPIILLALRLPWETLVIAALVTGFGNMLFNTL